MSQPLNPPISLQVALEGRSYAICIGSGLLADAAVRLAPVLPGRRAVLVSDETVAPLYAEPLRAALVSGGIACDLLTVEVGEGAKSFASLEGLLTRLLALVPDRKTALIALGGGVVGDLTGF